MISTPDKIESWNPIRGSAKKIVLSRIIEFKGDNDFNYHRRSGE